MKNCKWLHYLSHYITDGINLVRTLRIYLSVLVCFKLCFSELSPFSSNDVIWMGFFLMTGEERESGCDRLTEGGFFVCLGGEDTWGIKDVRWSSTLMLKKKNSKVTNESLFCSSCLFCSGSKKKKTQWSNLEYIHVWKSQDGSGDSLLKFENGVTYAKFMLAVWQTPVASTLDYYTCSRSCARLLL